MSLLGVKDYLNLKIMINNEKLLQNLFIAYYDARKNKRNKKTQLEFEINLESNLLSLYEELINWKYIVWKSIYFIQKTPVKREIFAWNFRDRIIHHLLYNYISPIFENEFIYDSYSCIKWRWTSFWIERINKAIRSCSNNYTEDCYILKLDISWYFMSINKNILYKKVEEILFNKKQFLKIDYDFIMNLIKAVIFNDCTKNSIFEWNRDDYIWLPKNKSLFFSNPWCGLPIWNLTSQLFSNIYLNSFDWYIKRDLNIEFYWRYVDYFFIIHKDKEYLLNLILKINNYLSTNLELTLHPKKIYIQHYTNWVLFLWVFIKPHRTYLRKRTIWFFYQKIQELNHRLNENNNKIDIKLKLDFISIINSYLWMFKSYKSYKMRKKILLNNVSPYFWNYFYISNNYTLIKIKNGYIWKLTSIQD